MKTCSKCAITKELSEFHSAGNGYLRGECKICQKKVVRERQASLREDYIKWKKTLKCNRCGFDDHRALQFHHKRDKEGNIANMIHSGFSIETVKAEAEKCEVLCANCHQIHHSPL